MIRRQHHLPNPVAGLLLLVIMVAAPCLLRPPAASAEPPVSTDPATTMDRYVTRWAAESGPGLEMVLLRDGVVVHTSAAGRDGRGQAVSSDTPMRVESVSKSFTAAAVMQLVERGRVRLDQSVRDQLPEFVTRDPRSDSITVRQLLTHSSGMDDAHSPDLYDSRTRTLGQAVARLSDAELATAPGTTFAYHNANYHVLARLVEVVSGQSFSDYLADHVFAPAGMAHSADVARSDDRVPDMAAGHLTAFGHQLRHADGGYFAEGSGGVISTATDLGRWLALQSNGGRSVTGVQALSAASVAQMHQPQSPDDSGYGFGWYAAESAEGPPMRISHSGAGGGFGAYQGIFPDSGWAVAVLVNHGAGLTAADPAVLAQNLLAEIDPQVPALQERGSGLPIDLIFTAVTLLIIAWTVWSIRRLPGWAGRRRRRHPWTRPLWFLPQLIAIALVISIPTLQLALTQRTAGWRLLFTVEPVAVITLATLGAASALVLVGRVVALLRRPSDRAASGGAAASA